jgi:hypothetical protein
MTRALNIHRGAGLGRPRAQLLDTSSTHDGAYVRNAPTVVKLFFQHRPAGTIARGPFIQAPTKLSTNLERLPGEVVTPPDCKSDQWSGKWT